MPDYKELATLYHQLEKLCAMMGQMDKDPNGCVHVRMSFEPHEIELLIPKSTPTLRELYHPQVLLNREVQKLTRDYIQNAINSLKQTIKEKDPGSILV